MTAIITGHGFLTGWRAEQYRRAHSLPTNGGEAPLPAPVPEPAPEPAPVESVPVLETSVMTPNFDAMNREDLRAYAKRLGVPGMGRMLKPDLIEAVRTAFVAAA